MKKVRINPYESSNAENSTFETTSFLFSINQRKPIGNSDGVEIIVIFSIFSNNMTLLLTFVKKFDT